MAISRLMIIGIVVVIAGIAVSLFFYSQTGNSPQTTALSTTINETNTTTIAYFPNVTSQQTTTVQQTNNSYNTTIYNVTTTITGGPGQSVISMGEAASLLGQGGAYNATNSTDPNEISAYEQQYLPNATIQYNIPQVFAASYYLNASSVSSPSLTDVVFQTQFAQSLYSQTLNYTNSSYAVANGVVDGMEYSYLAQSNSTLTYSVLFGWKGGEFAIVAVAGPPLDSTKLASIIAGDLK
ncbi:MAG: hypothetical protein KGH72_03595 [Candidatus Micrarchaeota archaeon]|nr:hypothetical protein [Candidatus Micrarchaeota archaeon]